MTDKIKTPRHLDPEIWKAALFIENAEDKQEAADRIDFLLKKKGDEFMAYTMAILCLPQLMEMVKDSKEWKDHFNKIKTRQYHQDNIGIVIMTKDIKLNESKFKIIKDSKDEPNLKEAQEFVGGYVEGITFPNGDYLIINEEGKLRNLPLNSEATMMWRATFTKDKYAFGYDDFVVGPAILIKKDALKIWAS